MDGVGDGGSAFGREMVGGKADLVRAGGVKWGGECGSGPEGMV